MRISDWSSDVCSSDLHRRAFRPFRQSDLARQSAPVGESTNLRIPVAAIVGRHILRPLARQRADKPAIVAEVVAAVMELHPDAVPRQARKRVVWGKRVSVSLDLGVRSIHKTKHKAKSTDKKQQII